MTDFSSLLYTSTCEIPTLLYTWSLKYVPFSGGASPYRPLSGVPSAPGIILQDGQDSLPFARGKLLRQAS